MSSQSEPQPQKRIELPDELWSRLLDAPPGAIRGIEISIRLFSGEVFERLIVSNRGYILGREAVGMAGVHGAIDDSALTFESEDIEAVRVGDSRFLKQPGWIALDPENPAWDSWRKRVAGH